jgi:16S rRNA (cytosine967-C5)-methyltransferase
MNNPRFAAVSALLKMSAGKIGASDTGDTGDTAGKAGENSLTGFSDKVLNSVLEKSELSGSDRKLAARIFYGCVSRQMTLDLIISQYSTKQLDLIDKITLNILRTAIYQLLWCDSVPDSAAVDESVKLTRQFRKPQASGFVNAVLRGFLRADKRFSYPENPENPDNPELHLIYEFSVNPEFLKMLTDTYGTAKATEFLADSLCDPPVFTAINTCLCDKDETAKLIEKYSFTPTIMPNLMIYKNSGIVKSKDFKQGKFYIQDISSFMCCTALSPQKNDRILDMCAAPGGKSFTLCELMSDSGEIIACDIHQNRANLITQGAARLRLGSIKAVTLDAAVYSPDLGQFDKILCDVPCSGYGVIRRKPEIRYKSPSEFAGLPEIQFSILENAAHYAKIGTEIVYSTCTLNKAENEDVVKRFLALHPEFSPMSFLEDLGRPFGNSCVTLFPSDFGGDGFFIAKMKKAR